MNDQNIDQSFLSGANATFINDLHKEWKENPNSVPKEWDLWFKNNSDEVILDDGPSWAKKNSQVIGAIDTVASVRAVARGIAGKGDLSAKDLRAATTDSIRAIMLIRAFRINGHLLAKLDPLNLQERDVHPELNLKLAGGIDDVWLNKDTNKLIMADYKAQSKTIERKIDGYLEDVYHEGYKLQLDFYRYLFEKNGFEVQKTAYFVVYNATLERDSFDNKLDFTSDLVAYETDTSHIEEKIIDMKKLMDGGQIPDSTPHCQNCNYIIAGSKLVNTN